MGRTEEVTVTPKLNINYKSTLLLIVSVAVVNQPNCIAGQAKSYWYRTF